MDSKPGSQQSYKYLSVIMQGSTADDQYLKDQTIPQTITLKSINLKIQPGQFVFIIGQIGSGKSSLINTLIGDLKQYVTKKKPQRQPSIDSNVPDHYFMQENNSPSLAPIVVRGNVAFVQQVPWIQNQSIRNNILFGADLQEQKYTQTIKICQLERDLQILPGGDLTEIGQRGINISGGQKARVSLARAVYSNPDIILMDDPVSALDANVKKKIFDDCLLGLLSSKTRILVTHALDFLHLSDRIIVMEGGRIIFDGDYDVFKGSQVYQLQFNRLELEKMKSNSSGGSPSPPSLNKRESSEKEQQILESLKEEEGDEDIENDDTCNIQMDHKPDQRSKSIMSTVESKIVSDEQEEKTAVGFNVYKDYFKNAGGFCIIITSIILSVVWMGVKTFLDYWLGYVSKQDDQQENRLYYFGMYGIFIFLVLVFVVARVWNTLYGGLKVSRKIHNVAINRVLRAPINLFFDKTPTGRIQNRFSKDLSSVDLQTSISYVGIVGISMWLIAEVALAIILNFWILIPIPLFFYLVIRFLIFFMNGSREFYRLESTTRSPILQFMGEMVSGASTIRAFKKEKKMNRKLKAVCDNNLKVQLISTVSNSFFAIGLNIVAVFFIMITSYLCVYYKDKWDTALIGLTLSYIMGIQYSIIWLFRTFIFNQGRMVSYQRLMHYSYNIPQESKQYIPQVDPKQDEWPLVPSIQYENYWLKYRPDTEVVLKNLNFTIKGGEKIGIVGRTGAGKSTICLSLLRIVEPMQGKILIDGIDITKIGLNILRRKITIIPQDPTLFKGTLKYNLDPLSQFTDLQINRVIQKTDLHKLYANDEKGVEMEILQNGSNLSSGERQVICIARALLKRSKIIVMDEATANIDPETQKTIQYLINQEFKHATVLVVAHRINTIINSDRVMFLSYGEVKEFDSPKTLLKNKDSMFYDLVKQLRKKELKGSE